MPRGRVEGLVRSFVTELEQVIRDEIRHAIDRRFESRSGAGHDGHYRAKGEKRTAEEIAALEAKFVAYVGEHPGLRIEQINKELGTITKDLMLPIRKLIASKKLEVEGEKRATRYALAKSGGRTKRGMKRSKKRAR